MNATVYESTTMSAVYNGSKYHGHLVVALPDHLVVIIWAVFWVIWCFGVLANFFTLCVLSKIDGTALNVFLMGLCASDILSAVTSPFIVKARLSAKGAYPWNSFGCKISQPFISVASAVTIQLVLVLSAWRLYAIQRPHQAAGAMTVKRARIIVILCWFVSSVVYISVMATVRDVVTSYEGRQICYYAPHMQSQGRMFTIIGDAILFNLLPISAIIVLCIATGVSVVALKNRRESISSSDGFRQGERNALIQVAVIVASFLIGYIPKFVFLVMHMTFRMEYYQRTVVYLSWRGILNFTEAVNPILYTASSSVIRNEMKRLFKNALCVKAPSRADSACEMRNSVKTAATATVNGSQEVHE